MRERFRAENYLRLNVVCYVNPQRMNRLPGCPPDRVLFSDKEKTLAILDGWYVQYQVRLMKYRNIKDGARLEQFLEFVRRRPDRFPGAHHVNCYGGISRQFKKQVMI